ncbi:hypothetical protein E4U41_003416 [Claviceps citrina]|nr:hypothetical protein E4U41_003416 [Claviceps citrina]
MENDDIDQETLSLILELQVHDVRSMIEGGHGAGEDRDFEVAAQILESELRGLASFYADRALSRSLADAPWAEADAMTAGPASSSASRGDTTAATTDDDGDGGRSPQQQQQQSNPAELRSCTACSSDVPASDTVRCPCSHTYCRDCMTELFTIALDDASLFPPRCCRQPIPPGLLSQGFLPGTVLATFAEKELEYATPNRTYCHVRTCSAFVPPASVRDDVATCGRCRARTCTICKAEAHAGHDCPSDEPTQDVLRLASRQGWQRCFSCRTPAAAAPSSATPVDSNGMPNAAASLCTKHRPRCWEKHAEPESCAKRGSGKMHDAAPGQRDEHADG